MGGAGLAVGLAAAAAAAAAGGWWWWGWWGWAARILILAIEETKKRHETTMRATIWFGSSRVAQRGASLRGWGSASGLGGS